MGYLATFFYPPAELVKASVKFMVEQLKPTDRLAIVAFDTRVDTVLPPTFMTAEGKVMACRAVEGVHAGGGTNLSGGLFEGLELFRRRAKAALFDYCIYYTLSRSAPSGPLLPNVRSRLHLFLRIRFILIIASIFRHKQWFPRVYCFSL